MSQEETIETMSLGTKNTGVGASVTNGDAARKRLRGFAIHMAAYLVIVIGLGAINALFTPGDWWFVFPMVLWGAPLALHAAYTMGMFKTTR